MHAFRTFRFLQRRLFSKESYHGHRRLEERQDFLVSSITISTGSFPGMTRGLEARVNGQIGLIMMALISGWTAGPPAARLYAVEPVGVETMRPSAR